MEPPTSFCNCLKEFVRSTPSALTLDEALTLGDFARLTDALDAATEDAAIEVEAATEVDDEGLEDDVTCTVAVTVVTGVDATFAQPLATRTKPTQTTLAVLLPRHFTRPM